MDFQEKEILRWDCPPTVLNFHLSSGISNREVKEIQDGSHDHVTKAPPLFYTGPTEQSSDHVVSAAILIFF